MKLRYLPILLAAFTCLQASAQTTFPVVVSVNGLVPSSPPGQAGFGVQLSNNGGDTITVFSDGTFSFPTDLATGAAYNVTIDFQPDNQTCSVANGSGVVANGPVIGPEVTCDAPPTTANSIPVMPVWSMVLMAFAISIVAAGRLRKNI